MAEPRTRSDGDIQRAGHGKLGVGTDQKIRVCRWTREPKEIDGRRVCGQAGVQCYRGQDGRDDNVFHWRFSLLVFWLRLILREISDCATGAKAKKRQDPLVRVAARGATEPLQAVHLQR